MVVYGGDMVAVQEVEIVKFSEDLLQESKTVKLRPWHFFGKNPLSNLACKVQELDDLLRLYSDPSTTGVSDRDLLIAQGNLMLLKLNLTELKYKLGLMVMGVVAAVIFTAVAFSIYTL